eukprot:g9666.t1
MAKMPIARKGCCKICGATNMNQDIRLLCFNCRDTFGVVGLGVTVLGILQDVVNVLGVGLMLTVAELKVKLGLSVRPIDLPYNF